MQAFLKWSTDQLRQAGIDSPRMEAELILASALGFLREDIYIYPKRILTEDEKSVLRDLINRRICREPMAHILGYKEFWSLDFKITPDVLIPRPETEILIESLFSLHHKNAKNQPILLLDIGTGSGVIAIVVALEISNCQIVATDFSEKALAIARINAGTHGVSKQVNFVRSDMFAEIAKESYDFIVSNPPYIETERLNDLMVDVRDFEPRSALDGGLDGLRFYRKIIPGALDYLKEGGSLVLEIGETQSNPLRQLLAIQGGYKEVKVAQDFSGNDRVVSARKLTNG